MTYADAGVDLDAADASVELLKEHVRSTMRAEVLGGIGGFGGLFELDLSKWQRPVLVSGTDGVGTKVDLARQLGVLDTVGIDLVAMVVDDLVVTGAEPLFFNDYVSVGRLVPEQVEALVRGIADGCRQAGAALVGGETAERTRKAVVGFVGGLALVGVTLVLHLVVEPTTEEPLVSLLVWLPGTAGLLSIVFGHAPSLVDLGRYRSTVVEPSRAFAASAAADTIKDPDGST